MAALDAPKGCPIRGNINGDGERSYDAPWDTRGILDITGELRGKKSMHIVLICLGVAGLFVLGVLYVVALINFSEWDTTLGARGDFVGGFGNPILTFLTFIGVLVTVALQVRSFNVSQKEAHDGEQRWMKQSKEGVILRFEQTFFQMLALHNSLVSQLDIVAGGETMARGRDCFRRYRKLLIGNYQKVRDERHGLTDDAGFQEAYNLYWNQVRQDLGHYFRFLYNIMRFIDEADHVEKEKYSRIVRAQLSDYELLALFYNCISEQGAPFTKYVVKYSMLDNMPFDLLIDSRHKGRIDQKAFASPPTKNNP